jgi:hypothetical protein
MNNAKQAENIDNLEYSSTTSALELHTLKVNDKKSELLPEKYTRNHSQIQSIDSALDTLKCMRHNDLESVNSYLRDILEYILANVPFIWSNVRNLSLIMKD